MCNWSPLLRFVLHVCMSLPMMMYYVQLVTPAEVCTACMYVPANDDVLCAMFLFCRVRRRHCLSTLRRFFLPLNQLQSWSLLTKVYVCVSPFVCLSLSSSSLSLSPSLPPSQIVSTGSSVPSLTRPTARLRATWPSRTSLPRRQTRPCVTWRTRAGGIAPRRIARRRISTNQVCQFTVHLWS